MKFNIKKLSKDLKTIRTERKASLKGSAREMKVPHATIFRIERGEHLDIHVGTFAKICTWINVKPENYFK